MTIEVTGCHDCPFAECDRIREVMKEILIQIVAYFLIYFAALHKRSGQSKIEMFSESWFIQIILITVGGIMLVHSR